jgi:hypothetical protein
MGCRKPETIYMVIAISRELEAALKQHAQQQGMSPEDLVVSVLEGRFMANTLREPHDEWERRLRALALDCGVSPSNELVSSEGIYDS